MNVLLLVIDDLRTELRSYGHAHMHTPRMDTLARQGVRFSLAYASWPVCAPSRASIMTGRTPDRMGFHDCCGCWREMASKPDLPTLFTVFSEAGYATAAFGKVTGSDPDCFEPGEIDGCSGGVWEKAADKRCYEAHPHPGATQRQWMGEEGLGGGCKAPDGRKYSYCETNEAQDPNEPDQRIADAARSWLLAQPERTSKAVPYFLLWVGLMRPRAPVCKTRTQWRARAPNACVPQRHSGAVPTLVVFVQRIGGCEASGCVQRPHTCSRHQLQPGHLRV
jgi:arylsulfatase A-like enzyme